MPQVAIGVAALAAAYGASTAAGSAAIAGTAAAAALTHASTVLYGAGVSMLLGAAASALMPQPRTGVGGISRKAPIQAGEAFWRRVYGRAMTSSNIVFFCQHGSWKVMTSYALVIASHEIDAVEELWIADKKVPLVTNGSTSARYPADYLIPDYNDPVGRKFWQDGPPRFAVKFFLGQPGQAAAPHLVSVSNGKWTSAHKLTGHAWCHFIQDYHPKVWQGGPPDVAFVVRGAKVHDPRSGTTGWSDNPALCLRDLLLSDWGLAGAVPVDEASVIAAANVCDELVAVPGGGTRKRYTCGGTLTDDQAPSEAVAQLLAAMAGSLTNSATGLQIHAGATRPSVMTLTDEDLAGTIRRRVRRPRSQLINSCKAIYADAADGWRPRETPYVTSSTWLAEDGGQQLPQDLRLGFVTRREQAEALARIEVERNRRQQVLELTAQWRTWVLEPLDVVTVVSARHGWPSGKLFQVLRVERSLNEGVGLTLVEYDDAIWSLPTSTSTPVAPPDASGPTPEAPAITLAVERSADGGTPVVRISWPVPETPADLELEWRHEQTAVLDDTGALVVHDADLGLGLGEEWASVRAPGSAGATTIGPVRIGCRVVVSARWRVGSALSDATTAGIWVRDLPALPGPTDLVARQASAEGDVVLTWRRPKVGSPLLYEIWTSRAGDNVATAMLVDDDVRGRRHRVPAVEPGETWWWVRGRQADGTTTSWSEPARLVIERRIGRLAGRDRITAADVEARAITDTVTVVTERKDSVGTSYSTIIDWIVEAPLDPIDPARTYGVRIDWALRIPDGTSATGITIRLERSRDGVSWGDTTEDARSWGSRVPRRETGLLVTTVTAGREYWRMRGKMTGATANLRDIMIVTTLLKG